MLKTDNWCQPAYSVRAHYAHTMLFFLEIWISVQCPVTFLIANRSVLIIIYYMIYEHNYNNRMERLLRLLHTIVLLYYIMLFYTLVATSRKKENFAFRNPVRYTSMNERNKRATILICSNVTRLYRYLSWHSAPIRILLAEIITIRGETRRGSKPQA